MKKVYLIPHFHYDVAWAFTKEDYLYIAELILKKILKIIKEKNFSFLIEQTYLLEQIEQRDPQLFADIEEAIASGNIEIADGQYIMADPMIPDGEVLIREILYGKRYCREKFSVDVPVAWAADGFGLNAQLPQIYKKSGYKWLAFRRGMPGQLGTKTSEFIWEGIDGSQITAHFMPLGYRAGLEPHKWTETIEKLSRLAMTDNILMPSGSGGIPPQEDISEKVDKWNNEHDFVKITITTPGSFFKEFDRDVGKLHIYRGELYSGELESIFPDVVSTRIDLKLALRDCETLMLMAEKVGSMAMLSGREYPEEQMTDLWKKMLFLAMHDIVPSCGIDEIYDEAWDYINEIKRELPHYIKKTLVSFVKSRKPALGIIVCNVNSWETTDWVETDISLGAGWEEAPKISSGDENIPSEPVLLKKWDDGSVRKARIGFVATVPPMGYRYYSLIENTAQQPDSKKLSDKKQVENRFFKLMVEPKTGILHLFNKKSEKLLEGNEIVIDQEMGDLYFHKGSSDELIGSESGKGNRFGAFKPEEYKVEEGSLRTVITYRASFYCLRWPYYLTEKFGAMLYRHKTVEITKQIVMYNDIPRLDFFTSLDLKQPHVRIRLKFDTCMAAPVYTRNTQFGAVALPQHKSLEETIKTPSLSWINCDEEERGIAFLTKGVPVNEFKQGEIYYTLIRSVSVLSADGISGPLIPTPGAMELGKHQYYYSVYPHSGDWRKDNIPKIGHEMTQPLFSCQVETSPEKVDKSWFSVTPESVILSALKQSEDNDKALIMRIYESHGRDCIAEILLPEFITSAEQVNLIEDEPEPLTIREDKLNIEIRPFEIITLKLYME